MESASLLRSLVFAVALIAACGSARSTGFDQGPGSGADGGGPGGPALDTDGGCTGDGPCSPPPDETTCAGASQEASNIGCEFWAVDLDNEYSAFNDAAGAPWGLVLSNPGDVAADVTIEQNDAPLGQPVQTSVVQKFGIPPGSLKEVILPTREVDGSFQGKDEGPGTFVSSRAFRVTSTSPIVGYQFNAMHQTFSNDASLLIPTNGLGTQYRVLGWPTANPISIGGIVGIPDHSYVTIVGVAGKTHVSVTMGGPIVAGGGIPATAKGGKVEADLGPFDVLNLESDGVPGDLTGTIVEATGPVVVFTGGERAIAPGNVQPPPPPGYDSQHLCCTDHLEEQLFPVTSMGKTFVVTRSPIRSSGGYTEPDILRFLAVAEGVAIKTNLPPPNDAFTLAPGDMREAWTTTDVVVEASAPIAVAQILVSQVFTNPSGGYTGDPSLTIFPPIEQYRKDYLFLVPTSWAQDFVVIAEQVGTTVTIDDKPLAAECITAPAGAIGGAQYEAKRCPIKEGAHRMAGSAPFGIVAYGYGPAGSYAFPGGADVRKIYTPPPLK